MTFSLFLLWLLSGGLFLYVQLRYAWANYPTSRKWLGFRFGSSFLNGILLGVILFYPEYEGIRLLVSILLSGIGCALLFTFGFNYNIQHVIPKEEPPRSDRE